MSMELKDDPIAWVRAVHMWDPNAVIAGAAAAKLTFAPDLEINHIRVYAPSKIEDRGLLRFRRSPISPQLVDYDGDVRVTSPEATAISAALDGDFEPGTIALRLGLITPRGLAGAAQSWRTRPLRATKHVVKVLSRNPWSVAEIHAHRLLRETGVIGWVANPRVVIEGGVAYPDIALLQRKIGFEINSYAYHSSKSEMERDASRMNLLIAAGWKVYALTAHQIQNYPDETAAFIRRVVPARYQRGVGGPDK